MIEVRRNTISDSVYATLREEIIELKLLPGEKLSEYRLADRFKVSRGPVRNALLKLEKEDLVSVRPQVGTIVNPISIRKALEIIEMRLLLEPHAASLAAGKVSDGDLRLLDGKVGRLEALGPGDAKRVDVLFRMDALLHRIVWERCGNREIRKALESYRSEINRIRLATYRYVDGFVPTADEIMTMVRALAARSPAGAKKAMRRHILNIKRAIEQVPQDALERIVYTP